MLRVSRPQSISSWASVRIRAEIPVVPMEVSNLSRPLVNSNRGPFKSAAAIAAVAAACLAPAVAAEAFAGLERARALKASTRQVSLLFFHGCPFRV